MARARQGKFARLTHGLREEVNHRLYNGETGGKILAWLNAQPDAIAIWDEQFDGAPATAQNLSEWRIGGYRDWRIQSQKVEDLKTLSSHAAELAKAGSGVESGVASVLAGHILESWETLIYGSGEPTTEGEASPNLAANFASVAAAATRLKKASIDEQKLQLDRRKTDQRDVQLSLEREKFQTQTVVKFLEWVKRPEAAEILDSGKPASVQMDLMRELMYGKEGAL